MEHKPSDSLAYKLFHRRSLPHYQPGGATLFVTVRLAGSLPAHVVRTLLADAERTWAALERLPDSPERAEQIYRAQKRIFGLWDRALDQDSAGPMWLRDPRIAALVVESLHYLDGRMFDLVAYCLMSNHAHLVFTPLLQAADEYYALSRIMYSLKMYTATRANRLLERQGAFWHGEGYDHVVRGADELDRIVAYVLNNPVKASLVSRWQDWPWSGAKALTREQSFVAGVF